MVRVIKKERGQARLPDPETLELDAFPLRTLFLIAEKSLRAVISSSSLNVSK